MIKFATSDLDCMLQELENNLKELIAAYERQKVRAERLEEELEKCRMQSEAAKLKIEELEEKVDTLGLRNAFAPSAGENAEARARIEALVREIDTALELLD